MIRKEPVRLWRGFINDSEWHFSGGIPSATSFSFVISRNERRSSLPLLPALVARRLLSQPPPARPFTGAASVALVAVAAVAAVAAAAVAVIVVGAAACPAFSRMIRVDNLGGVPRARRCDDLLRCRPSDGEDADSENVDTLEEQVDEVPFDSDNEGCRCRHLIEFADARESREMRGEDGVDDESVTTLTGDCVW